MSSLKVLRKGSPRPPPPDKTGILRLYGMRFCPYVQRVWLILTAKKIPYEMVNIHLLEKPDWYVDVNPTGKVPALEFDGKLITESLIIAEYLDEVFPQNRLKSDDPYERARDKMVLEQFHPLTALMAIYQGNCNPQEWWEDYQKNLEYLELELSLRKKPYFGGMEGPGMLDYMVWPWLERVEIYPSAYSLQPFREDRFPQLFGWKRRMAGDWAVQEIALTQEQHLHFLDSMRFCRVDYDVGL